MFNNIILPCRCYNINYWMYSYRVSNGKRNKTRMYITRATAAKEIEFPADQTVSVKLKCKRYCFYIET